MTKKVNRKNFENYGKLKEELEKLREAQLENINKAFADIQKKLNLKKEQFKIQFQQIYDKESTRLDEKIRPLSKFEDNIRSVEQIYKEISQIIQKKNQIELLG